MKLVEGASGELLKHQEDWIESVLIPWLSIDATESGNIDWRIAPSLVCRSEVELLGISSPRFALRTLFGKQGFSNVRRLAILQRTIGEFQESSSLPEHVQQQLKLSPEEGTTGTLQEEFQKSVQAHAFLADSLLVPSVRLQSRFRVLDCELSKAYGEQELVGPSVPFVQHMRFGGGLCAQAVAFMASCILQRWTKEIGGIPSVSNSLRRRVSGHDEIVVFDGLTLSDISVYFNAVRLFAPIERISTSDLKKCCGCASSIDWDSTFVSSYIASGMPVIAPMQVPAMKPIYDRIYAHPSEDIKNYANSLYSDSEKAHAVLLVGVEKGESKNGLLIQDPRSLPFIETDVQEVAKANLDYPGSRRFTLMPVTPSSVKLRLGAYRDLDGRTRCGLLDLFFCIEEDGNDASDPRSKSRRLVEANKTIGEWRLLGRSEKEDHAVISELNVSTKISSNALAALQKAACEHERWRWLHTIVDPTTDELFFTLWDAEKVPVDLFSVESLSCVNEFVLCAGAIPIGCGASDERVSSSSRGASAVIPAPHFLKSLKRLDREWLANARTNLDVALLSSFSTQPVGNWVWPDNVDLCELYAFMQTDRLVVGQTQTDAAAAMAAIGPDEERVKRIAKKVCYRVNRPSTRGSGIPLQIRSLATYFPYLAFSPDDPRARTGTSALSFALKLGQQLHEQQQLNDCPLVVEVVSGSRVTGLYPERLLIHSRGEDQVEPLFAYVNPPHAAISNLAQNLSVAFERSGVPADGSVVLALELEPLCLGTLTEFKDVVSFVKILDSETDAPKYAHVIGLNLDVAHWKMAGITPHMVFDNRAVLARIVHCHISGHHRGGHFGDIPVLTFRNESSDYYQWLDVLANAYGSHRGVLRGSGMITIECEAISPSLLADCVTDAKLLVECWKDSTSSGDRHEVRS